MHNKNYVMKCFLTTYFENNTLGFVCRCLTDKAGCCQTLSRSPLVIALDVCVESQTCRGAVNDFKVPDPVASRCDPAATA